MTTSLVMTWNFTLLQRWADDGLMMMVDDGWGEVLRSFSF